MRSYSSPHVAALPMIAALSFAKVPASSCRGRPSDRPPSANRNPTQRSSAIRGSRRNGAECEPPGRAIQPEIRRRRIEGPSPRYFAGM